MEQKKNYTLPSGFESPVTKEIIAKSKNIMTMGKV